MSKEEGRRKTEREMLEGLAAYIGSEEMERDISGYVEALEETVRLIGLDPDQGPGRELYGHLLGAFMYEDVEGDRRPIRLAQAIAVGMGLDMAVQTCGPTHELCADCLVPTYMPDDLA